MESVGRAIARIVPTVNPVCTVTRPYGLSPLNHSMVAKLPFHDHIIILHTRPTPPATTPPRAANPGTGRCERRDRQVSGVMARVIRAFHTAESEPNHYKTKQGELI
jgi:predicted GTPase